MRECPYCGREHERSVAPCSTCERQSLRVGSACRTCGGPLVSAGRGRGTYCPRCREPGDLHIVLIAPNGQERESWHPPRTILKGAGGETVRSRCERLKKSGLILRVSWPDWYSRTPRARPRRRYDRGHLDCRDCGKRIRRRSGNQIRCRECAVTKARQDRVESFERSRGTCIDCRRPDAERSQGLCRGCLWAASMNGRCACGRAKRLPVGRGQRRNAARAYCRHCDKPPAGCRESTVWVEITDGERFVDVEVSTRDGRNKWANYPVKPLVLVSERNYEKRRPGTGAVISGIRVPGGTTGHLILEAAQDEPLTPAVLDATFGQAGWVRALFQLVKNDFLEKVEGRYQPTEKGRATWRWIQKARAG